MVIEVLTLLLLLYSNDLNCIGRTVMRTVVVITVNKKSCSVSFNFYTTQRHGPKNRILIWNLFWDCRSVAIALLLDNMSEQPEKLYGV